MPRIIPPKVFDIEDLDKNEDSILTATLEEIIAEEMGKCLEKLVARLAKYIIKSEKAYFEAGQKSREKKIVEKLEHFFEPATGTRGQGGLPQPGTIKDWQFTVTKDGWKLFKESLSLTKEE